MSKFIPSPWSHFNRVPNADAIAAGLKDIPRHWSLTPLQEKSALRVAWQTEDFIPHSTIANLILNGEVAVSKKGNRYRGFQSGFGLRLGEASGGLLAIDVDGSSAQPILEAMSRGHIPNTVSWTSGKPGRYQLAFQIPDHLRDTLREFTRSVVTKWGEITTLEGELLEFRYNYSQSALPPSRHPEMGAYKWINSPTDTEVAIAPDWLCEIFLQLANKERQAAEAKLRAKLQREKTLKESAQKREALGIVGSVDLVDCFAQSVGRLTPEEIFNWPNHNFKDRGREWFGCCPQHQSQSGLSFTVNPDTLEWHCFGCNIGGGVGEYRHFVNGGRGTPRGKDFFEVTKGLASQAGIELPKLQVKEKPIASQTSGKQAKAQPTPEKQGFGQTYQEKAKDAWCKAKRFSADIKTASQWCDWKLPPQNSIFFGRAGLGRGKTTRLRNWVRTWQEEGKGFICLGYRNTLLLQLCEKLGFYHLNESDSALMRSDPSSGIALCVDSLWRFSPEEFNDKVLILDEVMSVIRHLLHSPTVKGRDNILELFQEALRRASQVICLDGCMADWAIKYLHELAPGKKIIRAENTFQGDKPLVNYLLGTVDIEEEVKKNDRSPWLHYLLNDSPVPAICSDSQVFIESLDNLLTEQGLKTLRVDSKTVPEEYVKDFLKDCNGYIEKHQPDAILYTPSAESGVDISIQGYFSHHFAFFFGVLGVDAILQMLGRIRDAKCTKFVWVREWVAQSEQSHSKSPFTKKIGEAIQKMLCSDITDTISGIDRDQDIISRLWAIIQNSRNAHFQASNQIQAISNYEKSNLRECVRESLEASGYPIRLCTLSPAEESKGRVKDATEATKRQNCHDIFTAEKIPLEFADELSKKFDARWEERTKVIQAHYRSRLPGIDETQSWTEDFIYKIRYDNPDFINQQELFWLYCHPEEANRMNLERYHRIAQRERTFIGGIRSRMARVRALRAINFERFLNPEAVWEEDSPELVQLIEQCMDEKIAAALGRYPGKQARIRFLGSLLKMVGLKFRGQKIKSEDGDYRIYQLDRDTLSDSYRRDALQCLDRRWENYVKKEVEILDWEPVLNPQSESQEAETIENSTCQQAGGHSQQAKPTQNQSGQGFDPVPRTPTEYIYINEASWNQLDLAESQGLSRQVGKAADPRTDLQRLVDALEGVGSLEEFSQLVGGREVSIVKNAIAFAPSQPRRRQLSAWLSTLVEPAAGESSAPDPQIDEQEEKRQVSLAKLLSEAFEHGWDTVKAFLSRLDLTDRWISVMKLEEIDEARSRELLNQDFYRRLSAMP
jgi:hypothetical protein